MTPQEAADVLQNNKARIPMDLWDAVESLTTKDRPKFQFYVLRRNLMLPVEDFGGYPAMFHSGPEGNKNLQPNMWSCWDGRWLREWATGIRHLATARVGYEWRNTAEVRRLTLEVVNNEHIPEPKRR